VPDTDLKYRAFLSYSHRDTGWAKWLHARLEGFRIDKDLIGRETPVGPVPKTLRPIFRDREDFSGGHTLADATITALDASAALIVLCSTISAGRAAVNEEVRLFRARHPDRPVIPVIIDGTWPENFPPALRHELTADGTITDRPVTILGPDLRESADGKNLGLAKIVAGLTGLSADDVFRRAERARRRRTRIWRGVAAFCLLLAVLATGSAVYAWHELKTNEAFLAATLKTATDIVNTAVTQAEKYNVPRSATLELLTKAEGLFNNMAQFGRPTPDLQYQKAWMLIEFARNYAILGDTGQERAHAAEAFRLLSGLAAAKPNDPTYQYSLAAAYDEIGDVQVPQGNLPAALTSYQASLAIRERLAKSDPSNAGWQRNLSLSYEKVGDVQVAQGNLPAALTSSQASLTIRERLAKSDPGNAGWQHDLSIPYERIGDVQVAQGNLPAALTSYQASLAIRESLAKSDPGNAGWQRDLSVSYERVGDVQVDQGNLPAALTSYQVDLAIMDRLMQSDPSNARWQRDLSAPYERVGDVQVAQGNLPAALTSYQASLAIRERLAKFDPSNALSQDDLSLSYERVGDVQLTQGNLTDALASYQAALAIMDRLVKSDPSNARWQRALSVSYSKLAEVYLRSKQISQAQDALAAGRAILAPLTARHPEFSQWKQELAWFDRQIAALKN
jgi:tetratricopeptide (TPR) repeat protein